MSAAYIFDGSTYSYRPAPPPDLVAAVVLDNPAMTADQLRRHARRLRLSAGGLEVVADHIDPATRRRP